MKRTLVHIFIDIQGIQCLMPKFPGFDKDIFKSTPEMEVEEECEILQIIE